MREGRRWRRRRRGRPPKPRRLIEPPSGWGLVYVPFPVSEAPPMEKEPIVLAPDEFMALWLVYYEGLTQDEAAEKLGVSRGTLWRLLDSGRRKLVGALISGRPFIISGSMPTLPFSGEGIDG
ncbi:MAG: DUF134 domain-containing protein [Desulfurococcales archaeon]|nr:DUF134 domain-containing protein [Desulfurococcales archaeon]